MKWVKKELDKIPYAPYPNGTKRDKGHRLVMLATTTDYQGEQILVVTFYRIKSKQPACRVFLSGDAYITKLCESGEWTTKGLDKIRYDDSLHTMDSGVLTAHSKAAEDTVMEYIRRFTHYGADYPLRKIVCHQEQIRQNRRDTKRKKQWESDDELMEDVFSRLPPLPEDMEERILDGILKGSRYMFFRRGERHDPLTGQKETQYYGYCSHCRKEYPLIYAPEHKEKGCHCPQCRSMATAYSRGRSRKKLVDWCHYAVLGTDGEDVFFRFFAVERDYSGEPEYVKTRFDEVERFYFTRGVAVKFTRYDSYFGTKRLYRNWLVRHKINEDIETYSLHPYPEDSLKGTCLAHCHMDDYMAQTKKREDATLLMQYLDCYVKTPAMEHLLDAGLYKLVRERVRHINGLYRMINWEASRPRDMLGVSQPELEQIATLQLDGVQIRTYKRLKPYGVRLTQEDKGLIELFSQFRFTGNLEVFDAAHQLGMKEALRYLRYQHRKAYEGVSFSTIWVRFKDYHGMCEKLGYDLDDSYYRFPPDLKKAHDAAAKIVTEMAEIEAQKRQAEEQRQWEQQYEDLSGLIYSDGTLIIRPVASRAELIEEGKILQHCVAGYADRVLRGETLIFLIRRADQPDEPYYTLNTEPMPKLQFKQCHGFKNDENQPGRIRPQSIQDFEAKWFAAIVEPWKKKKAREKISVLQSTANATETADAPERVMVGA